MDDGRVLDLLSCRSEDSFEFTIPDAAPPVRVWRLHVDPETRASLSLVEFPVRWCRPGRGHYLAGEEFVVLRGSLQVSARLSGPGAWAWLPPGVTRWDSCSRDGALALAWFSGPAVWCSGDGPTAGTGHGGLAAAGPLRVRAPGVPGRSAVLSRLPAKPVQVDRDVLALRDFSWAFVPAGRAPGPVDGPVLERRWS
ncbi:MAG: hypothetical protein ACRDWT_10690 [Jatrophihabitantaceae bacterium]